VHRTHRSYRPEKCWEGRERGQEVEIKKGRNENVFNEGGMEGMGGGTEGIRKRWKRIVSLQ
jgi:hypothetical protein